LLSSAFWYAKKAAPRVSSAPFGAGGAAAPGFAFVSAAGAFGEPAAELPLVVLAPCDAGADGPPEDDAPDDDAPGAGDFGPCAPAADASVTTPANVSAETKRTPGAFARR
jgi:hypothetical protein